MRLQDVIRFSLELLLPQSLTAAQSRVPDLDAGPLSVDAGKSPESSSRARSIITQLDNAELGGPSFGPETLQIMEDVLNTIDVESQEPLSDETLHQVASALLKAAADGERDAGRLKARALDRALQNNSTANSNAD